MNRAVCLLLALSAVAGCRAPGQSVDPFYGRVTIDPPASAASAPGAFLAQGAAPAYVPPAYQPPAYQPQATAPTWTPPTATLPAVTTPAVTVPAITTPALALPTVTTPTVTVPPITVPPIAAAPPGAQVTVSAPQVYAPPPTYAPRPGTLSGGPPERGSAGSPLITSADSRPPRIRAGDRVVVQPSPPAISIPTVPPSISLPAAAQPTAVTPASCPPGTVPAVVVPAVPACPPGTVPACPPGTVPVSVVPSGSSTAQRPIVRTLQPRGRDEVSLFQRGVGPAVACPVGTYGGSGLAVPPPINLTDLPAHRGGTTAAAGTLSR